MGLRRQTGYNRVVGTFFKSSDSSPIVTLDWASMILQQGDPTSVLGDVEKRLRATPKLRLLITFKDVNHLSSQSLGILVRIHKRVAMAGGQLRIAELSGPVRDVFRLTHMDQMLAVHKTAAEALEAFATSGGQQG